MFTVIPESILDNFDIAGPSDLQRKRKTSETTDEKIVHTPSKYICTKLSNHISKYTKVLFHLSFGRCIRNNHD